jgi:uncharacterized protein YecE (DUF72 family)
VYRGLGSGNVGGTTPELTYLSHYFDTCEIHATFYRQFEPEIGKKWSDAVENPRFEFAIKANQVFGKQIERQVRLRVLRPC